MASVTVTDKALTSQGSDRNKCSSQRVRTVGSSTYQVEDNIADNNTTVTLWAAGDGGLSTFDFGKFQIDPFGSRSDGASDSDLILEISGATQTIAMQALLEVPTTVPGQITDDVDGTLEDVTLIRVKNTNAEGVGDLRCKLTLFGRSA